MRRLAALFELTRAEEEGRFTPGAYDLSTEEAMRVAAVFAEFDKNSDGEWYAAEQHFGSVSYTSETSTL